MHRRTNENIGGGFAIFSRKEETFVTYHNLVEKLEDSSETMLKKCSYLPSKVIALYKMYSCITTMCQVICNDIII